MLLAGTLVVTAFFVFAAFALVLLLPGLLLYRAGLRNIYNDMNASGNIYDNDNVKMIDVSASKSGNEFIDKGKKLLKSGIKKIRNFLNKYAD